VIAFLVAREMAHVIARHAEEDSGASLVLSALGALLPGFNVVERFVATTLGGDALKGSWEAKQQLEADEIAIALLERTGVSALSIARSLQDEAKHEHLPDSEWGARYAESLRRATLIATTSPRYTVSGD
jgi:predicted Zn-dependent protease